MKTKLLLSALLLLPLGYGIAQEKKPTPASAPKDDPRMQKMMELGTPGPAHRMLDGMIGNWQAEVKHWMEPGGQAETSTGTSSAKWILDDHYVESTFTGDMMGMPFEGRGVCGYDNIKKKYFSTWFDSMATGFMVSEGTFDPSTKTFTYTGQAPDCFSGKYVAMRSIVKMVDADHMTMEMYGPGPDGKEFKNMEIAYTRTK
jgi:hypothetical protein